MKSSPSPARRSSQTASDSSSPLRKLIRCKRTGTFLAKDGTWTHDFRKALAVAEPSVPDQLQGFQPSDIEIYYSFDAAQPSSYDFTIAAR